MTKESGSEILVLMRSSLYSTRVLHCLLDPCPLLSQPSVQPKTSLHAIKQAHRLEVAALVWPNCLFCRQGCKDFTFKLDHQARDIGDTSHTDRLAASTQHANASSSNVP